MNAVDLVKGLYVAVAITAIAVITIYVPAFVRNYHAHRENTAEGEARDFAWLLIGGILIGWASCAINYWWLVFVFYWHGTEPILAPYLPNLPRFTWLIGWLLSGAIHIAVSQRNGIGMLRSLFSWLVFITVVVLLSAEA